MQRQMQERTQSLNIMGDSTDKVEESSSNWADDVNKFVSKQKKKAVMGCKCSFRPILPSMAWNRLIVLQLLGASLGSKAYLV